MYRDKSEKDKKERERACLERVKELKRNNKIYNVKPVGLVENYEEDPFMPDLHALRKEEKPSDLKHKLNGGTIESEVDLTTLEQRVNTAPIEGQLNELLALAGCAAKQRVTAFTKINSKIESLRETAKVLNELADEIEEEVNFAKRLIVTA